LGGGAEDAINLAKPTRRAEEQASALPCLAWCGQAPNTESLARGALIGAPHERAGNGEPPTASILTARRAAVPCAVRRAFLNTTQSLVAPAASTHADARLAAVCAPESPPPPVSSPSFAPSATPLQRAFQTPLRACHSLSFTRASWPPPAPSPFVFTPRPPQDRATSTAGCRYIYSPSLPSGAPLPPSKHLKHRAPQTQPPSHHARLAFPEPRPRRNRTPAPAPQPRSVSTLQRLPPLSLILSASSGAQPACHHPQRTPPTNTPSSLELIWPSLLP
jgi:hypothetical protein